MTPQPYYQDEAHDGCDCHLTHCRWCGTPKDNHARHGYGMNFECVWPCNHEVAAGEQFCGYCAARREEERGA